MAKSGQVNTNTTYDSYFWVKWEQVGNQDIANNRTQIKWSCGVYCGHSFYSNAIKMSAVYINGVLVYGGGTYSNIAHTSYTFASGTMWINHNADGTKTFSISSFTGWLYSNHNYSSSGGSFDLEDIPRDATITDASNFTDQENPWIKVSNPAGYKTHYLWLEPNPPNPTKHLCLRYDDIPNNGTYAWDLSTTDKDALRNNCTGPSCPIRLGMYYKVGSETKATYLDKTFTVVESDLTRPTVNMQVGLDNSLLPNPDKFEGMYIQGKSRVTISLSATGKYGADIKSYSAQVDGKTYNSREFTSDVLQGAGSVKVTGYAKDSREITGSLTKTIDVKEYSKPLVIPLGSENAVLCYRSDDNGKRVGNSESVWVKAKRFYYGLGGENHCALQYRVKLVNEAWSDSWADLISGSDTGDGYDALIPGVKFDLKDSYTVQIRAIDDIGEFDIKTFEIPTQDVALHLGKGGKKVAVGTYCTDLDDYTFYSEWKAIFDKEVVIGGYPVADHIVEAGTSGDWTYVKMASGVAECWAKISYTVDLVAENSRAYVYLNRTFPIAFKDLPFCNVTLANQTTWNQVLSSADFTESLFKSFTVYRMGAGVNVTAGGTADIRVIGYWK